MIDSRTYTKIEGFEAEVDIDIELTDLNSYNGRYGVALMVEGPLVGYEVLILPEALDKLKEQWGKENYDDLTM